MDKYKLNDRYVRDASNYILDFILSSNDIKLEDGTKRRKLIRHINTVIRAIKIDDLTAENNRVMVGTIIHPCENPVDKGISPQSETNRLFPRILLEKQKKNKKK